MSSQIKYNSNNYPSLIIQQNDKNINKNDLQQQQQWTLKQKQDYLYKHILQAQCDPQQFQQYLDSLKGLDLNQYSKQQIIKAVINFKNKQKINYNKSKILNQQDLQQDDKLYKQQQLKRFQQKNINKESKQKQKQQQQQQSLEKYLQKQTQIIIPNKRRIIQSTISQQFNINQNNNSINNTALYRFYSIKKKRQTDLFKQKMLQKGIKSKVSNLENSRKNQHQNKKLSISITKAIKSQKTFILFTTSYIQYQIITRSQNINWKVKRRFNQFKWLHDILIQRYPYLPIPPIPPKTTMRSFDQLHIQDRRITFQKFLNKLIDSPELCSQSIVQDFLQIDNNQEFKKIKQEYQKYVQLTVNGKSDQIQTIYDDQQFQPKRIAINDQILDNYKIISELYGKIVGKTSEIDLSNQNLLKSYTQLSQLFSKLFEKQKLFKGNGLHHLVIQFLNQLKQWTMMTNNIVGKYVKDTYCYQQKYLQKYLSQMRRIRKHNNTISQKYKQIFQKYAQGQVPVLDPAENNKLSHSAKYFRQFQRQKQDYKIGLGNLLRQIQRYYEKGDMLKSHSKIWQNGLNVYMDGIRQNMVGGVDLLTKIMSLKEGKELIEVQYKKQYMKKVQKQKEKENMKEKENVSSYIVLDSMEQQLEQKK